MCVVHQSLVLKLIFSTGFFISCFVRGKVSGGNTGITSFLSIEGRQFIAAHNGRTVRGEEGNGYVGKLYASPFNNYRDWSERFKVYAMQKYGSFAAALVAEVHLTQGQGEAIIVKQQQEKADANRKRFPAELDAINIANDMKSRLFGDLAMHLSEESFALVRNYRPLPDGDELLYSSALVESDFVKLWMFIKATHDQPDRGNISLALATLHCATVTAAPKFVVAFAAIAMTIWTWIWIRS